MRRTYNFAFSLAAAFLFGCASDHALPTESRASATVPTGAYTAIVLTFPENAPSALGCGFATAINASGEAAGTTCGDGVFNLPIAWSATTHAPTLLDSNILPTNITGISNNGTIVGWDTRGEVSEALEWKNGSLQTVDKGGPFFDSQTTFALFICATDCTIVGSFQEAPDSDSPGPSMAAIWTRGIRVDVAAPPGTSGADFVSIGGGFFFGNIIDDNGSDVPARWSARGWERLPMPPDPSGLGTFITSANAAGVAVGVSNGSGTSGVMWPLSGVLVTLTPPDGYPAFIPLDINASGLVVGYLSGSAPSFTSTAAYWTSQAGFRLLPNGAGGQAMAVNDRGEIVGFSAGGTPMFWEPAFPH